MLDINLIRTNPDKVKQGIVTKGYDASLVDKVLDLDEKRRRIITLAQELRSKSNEISSEAKIKIALELVKKELSLQDIIKRAKEIKEERRKYEAEESKLEKEFEEALFALPNLPTDDTPRGKDDSGNQTLREWGKPTHFAFKPKDHLEIGEALRIIDVERAAKVSGTRFSYLIGEAVILEFALVQFALETLIKEKFIPVIPPVLIRPRITKGLSYWESGGNENYYLVNDPKDNLQEFLREDRKVDEFPGFYLVGTAEHSIVPMHSGEVFSEKELPRRYVAFSSAFRREAGTYGKDTRGIFRVHQFDKIEMVSFTKPSNSRQEHEYLLSLQEKLMQSLNLPYRVVQVCSGDMAFPTARQFDIETWFPSENKYRETHSISTTTDFQARRLNIKYRKGNTTEFVHILNGTAFAIGRTIIAILENYQQKDGSVVVPQILRKWVGKEVIFRSLKQ